MAAAASSAASSAAPPASSSNLDACVDSIKRKLQQVSGSMSVHLGTYIPSLGANLPLLPPPGPPPPPVLVSMPLPPALSSLAQQPPPPPPAATTSTSVATTTPPQPPTYVTTDATVASGWFSSASWWWVAAAAVGLLALVGTGLAVAALIKAQPVVRNQADINATLQSGVNAAAAAAASANTALGAVNAALTSDLNATQAELAAEASALAGEVSGVAAATSGVTALTTNVSTLSSGVSTLNSGVSTLQARVALLLLNSDPNRRGYLQVWNGSQQYSNVSPNVGVYAAFNLLNQDVNSELPDGSLLVVNGVPLASYDTYPETSAAQRTSYVSVPSITASSRVLFSFAFAGIATGAVTESGLTSSQASMEVPTTAPAYVIIPGVGFAIVPSAQAFAGGNGADIVGPGSITDGYNTQAAFGDPPHGSWWTYEVLDPYVPS